MRSGGVSAAANLGIKDRFTDVEHFNTENSIEYDLILYKSLRGNACMAKDLAKIEGLEAPERIHSTELRKFCATVTQIADLSENDLG